MRVLFNEKVSGNKKPNIQSQPTSLSRVPEEEREADEQVVKLMKKTNFGIGAKSFNTVDGNLPISSTQEMTKSKKEDPSTYQIWQAIDNALPIYKNINLVTNIKLSPHNREKEKSFCRKSLQVHKDAFRPDTSQDDKFNKGK